MGGGGNELGDGCNEVGDECNCTPTGDGVGSSGLSRRGRVSIRYIFYGQDSISVVDHPRAQRLSVDTPFGDGCNDLRPRAFVPAH